MSCMDDSYLEYELCHAQSVELGYMKMIQVPPATVRLHILAILMYDFILGPCFFKKWDI